MSQTLVPTLLTPAVPIVQGAYEHWSGTAAAAFDAAQRLVGGITNPNVTPINFNIPFDLRDDLAPYPTITPPDPFDLSKADPGAVDAPPLLPAFTFTQIGTQIQPPTENFSFSPGAYTDWLLDKTKQTLSAMQDGGFVLPPAAAAALRNRAFEAANREEMRGTDQVYSDFAARGFDEPPGLLNRRLTEVRDAARFTRSGTNRDVYAQDQQIAQENFRLGVSGATQLEGVLIQLFTTEQQMQLEAAKFGLEMAERIFDARVRLLVAQNQIIEAQASVYMTQVNALLGFYRAKIDKYEADCKRIEVKKDAFLGNVGLYDANARVAMSASEYNSRAFSLKLERERAKVDTAIKEAEQSFEQIRFIASLAKEVQTTLATVQSQLAASAMNAVHVGASMSYGGSESISWGTSVSGSLD